MELNCERLQQEVEKMKRKFWIVMMIMLWVVVTSAIVSCSQKTVKTESSVTENEKFTHTATPAQTADTQAAAPTQTADVNNSGTKDSRLSSSDSSVPSGVAIKEESPLPSEGNQHNETAVKKVFPEDLILFDFDSSILTADARDRLKRKAQWLRDNPDVSIIIQGHCDERGTEIYNMSLGQKRAQSAKAFLVDMGIPAARFLTVSFGEGRPLAEGHDENSWKLNRRAHFVIQ